MLKRVYTEQNSWGPSFTDYVMKILPDFARKGKSSREELFIAEAEGKPVGCMMICETDEHDAGQLRIYAVEKECRNFGIGSALTDACFSKARSAGYRKLVLWTSNAAHDAIRQYEKLGFETVETVENTSWSTDGSTVYELKMELDIRLPR